MLFFFFFFNEILFSDSLKTFLLSGRRSPIFYGQTAKFHGKFWRHLISFTVIVIAVENHTDIIYKVLKKGAYVHAQSAQSCFSILPIHNVVFHNSTILIAALHLSDPSIVNKTSRETLNWACTKTTKKMVKILGNGLYPHFAPNI